MCEIIIQRTINFESVIFNFPWAMNVGRFDFNMAIIEGQILIYVSD